MIESAVVILIKIGISKLNCNHEKTLINTMVESAVLIFIKIEMSKLKAILKKEIHKHKIGIHALTLIRKLLLGFF